MTGRGSRAARGQAGFSIVEILVAMALLVVGVLAVVGLFTKSQESATTAQRHEVALAQAEQALEEVRALPYDQVTLTAPPPLPLTPGEDDDEPSDRVEGSMFEPAGEAPEELVVDGDEEAGAGPAAVAPISQVQVGETGAGPMTMRVQRFVSWRDEECILTSVSNISTTLEGLRASVNNLVGEDGTLPMLVGRIDTALLERTELLTGPVATLLNSTVRLLLSEARTKLEAWKVELAPFPDPLAQLLADLDAVLADGTEGLDQRLDLCDLKALENLDLNEMRAITDSLNVMNEILADTLEPVDDLTEVIVELQGMNLLNATVKLANATLKLPGYLSSLGTRLNDLRAALLQFQSEHRKTLLSAITDVRTMVRELRQFLAQPDTEKNTKRVTVAVWLDPATQRNVGPMKPVWVSTVVTDPSAGLL